MIAPEDVPRFLEDYADIFLSFSYYRYYIDDIMPIVDDFLASLADIRGNWQLRQDRQLLLTCDSVEANFTEIVDEISRRFSEFEIRTQNMWKNLSAISFRNIERTIRGNHAFMGATLCTLSVKMNAWQNLFPNQETGGPVKRADFIMSDIRYGLDRLRKIIDRDAPSLQMGY